MQAKRILAVATAATALAALVITSPAGAHGGHGPKIGAPVLGPAQTLEDGGDTEGTLREWRPGDPRRGPRGSWGQRGGRNGR